jgi:hypothetical protein
MKLWIIALAISAAAGCGHESESDNAASTTVNQAAVAPQSPEVQQEARQQAPPQTTIRDTAMDLTNGNRAPEPTPPVSHDPNRTKDGKPKQPATRPKPQPVDFTK